MTKTITLLNGFAANDPAEDRLLSALGRVTGASSLHEVVVRDLRLGDCCGCFDCFVKTPGSCKMRDDASSVLQQILSTDVLLTAGRISFGGYGSVLKRMLDRIIPLILPFFHKSQGDTHHPARYQKMPKFVGVGTFAESPQSSRQSDLFCTLVGRNALNLNSPSYAALAVPDHADPDELDRGLREALGRSDPWPSIDGLTARWPGPQPSLPWPTETQHRVLSIVGSPKNGPSNSAVLSSYFEDRLRGLGWETETYRLNGDVRTSEGHARLVAAVERADLVSLAAPLYVDSLHHRVTLAFELLAAERARWAEGAPKRFVATMNCGFPETHQNVIALSICKEFATAAGFTWVGGLSVGAGETLNAEPLDAAAKGRPPTHHLRAALDSAALAVHRGEALPVSAQALLDRSPIPGLPGWLWRMLFRRMGTKVWHRMASAHGIEPSSLGQRPLAC